MSRILALLLAVICGAHGGVAADAADRVVAAALIKRVPPRYPAKAIERGQEGWVDLRFAITPEGATSDIRIVASYPRGVFERTAANALAKWVYAPRRENGIAVPQGDNRAVLSFALAESASIREPLRPAFEAATSLVRAHRWDDAAKAIKELTDTQALSLFELAAIEQLRGEMAFAKLDYGAAADCFSRALSITTRFDGETRAAIAGLLVMASINGRDYARAVQAFDAWNPPDTPATRELRRTVEAVRGALAAGRPIELAPVAPR